MFFNFGNIKKLCFTIIFLLHFFNIDAQQIDKSIGSIKYQLFHQRDTLSSEYYKEFMGVVFSSHSTVYFSLNKQLADSVLKAQVETQMAKNGGNITLDMRSAPQSTPGAYYTFYSDNKAVMEKPFMQVTYVYDASLPKIEWQLSDETKNIATYNCKKAIGAFGGREYQAWYCPDIPVNAGPWRLSGLPGLILEAKDTTQQVKFVSQSFSTTEFYGHEIIELPANAEKTTKEKFDKMIQAMRDNPQEFLNNTLPGGGTIKINSITKPVRNLYNNPMELPEKKVQL